MIQQFFGRREELAFLEKQYQADTPSLVILYGRRRVGKTELIKQFLKNKPNTYYMFDEQPEEVNIKALHEKTARNLKNDLFSQIQIQNWYQFFENLCKLKKKKEKFVLALDEFPYIIKSNNAIPSIFQKIWDEILKNENIMLILCGSSIAMMEQELLAHKSPLYGRRTGQWKVEPFTFEQSHAFLEKSDIQASIQLYGLADGIPLYLKKLHPETSIKENILKNIAQRGEFLYEEAEFLLKQEFREPGNYFLIVKAIALGKTKFGDIVNFTNLDKTICSKYLDNLIKIRVIEKKQPVPSKGEKTRYNRYYITDHYLKFWFSIIYPNKSLIEEGALTFGHIQQPFLIHTSFVFEDICKQIVKKLYPTMNKIGKWWEKEQEIDLVGLNNQTKEILFIEIKYKDSVDAHKLLTQLEEKSKYVQWNNQTRTQKHIVFAKSFKNKTHNCYDLQDIEKILKKRKLK
ncbi:MAG: ATP-binding protein [Candidatus Woesearchaeota archaeon]